MATLADKTREEWLKLASGELAPTSQEIIEQIGQLEQKYRWLEEQVILARDRQFGASSEKMPVPEHPNLFNEAEACAEPAAPEPTIEQVTYTRRKGRPKGKRDADLAGLPEQDVEYELPEDKRACPQCNNELHDMGCDVRREIKIVPATVTVVNHKKHKYACRNCQIEETTTPIVTAPMPEPAFPNSIASAEAVAHIMTEKFVMGSPLYRIELQFERNGFDLSRQTMANWMIKGAEWLDTIYAALHGLLLLCGIIHADETELQVLRESGRAPTTTSFAWLYRSGWGPPIALFEYQQTRAAKHPIDFLTGYVGYLLADGYEAYKVLAAAFYPRIILLGCWAHARRYFVDAVKVLPAAAQREGNTASHAGLSYCNRLFEIERQLADATPEQRFEARLALSKPLLAEIKTWRDGMATSVLPKSALGKAIAYLNNQWETLNGFLLDGRLEIDNNRAERTIRPFCVGRKNWLFANTPNGANASAKIYSIVETAKDNGLNPYDYLTYLFKNLPNIDRGDPEAVARLLPWRPEVQAACASGRSKQVRNPGD